MSVPKPTLNNIKKGISRYKAGERPWRETFNRVDWFILHEDGLFPLKYTYGLAMDIQPSTYTTDQMKAAMNHLGLYYHSLKSQQENIVAFEKEVSHSLIDGKERAKRLKTAEKKPKRLFLYQIVFQRNPDVVAEVLTRANGVCECCKQRAPFSRASDGSPYLEVHHKIFLSDGGEDTVENAEALCPNCHRKKHYG